MANTPARHCANREHAGKLTLMSCLPTASPVPRLAIRVVALLVLLCAGAQAETHRWTQYGPAGLEARAVTDGAACPALRIDGRDASMTPRAQPGPGFAILACAAPLPPGAAAVTLDGAPLPLPPPNPSRILVIGDTGCRLKGAKVQACNDPLAWPFPRVAEIAAAEKPDLVIHVGDYNYRETPCPPGNAGCAGSPFGDNWPTWRTDFFAPAAPLLAAAPWVMVRGNHEICDRGGKGWSRILDPHPFNAAAQCNGLGQPFIARIPGLDLHVMDVSSAEEESVDPRQVGAFRRQFQAPAASNSPAWMLFHRPIWSIQEIRNGKQFGVNRTLAKAATGAIPSQVQMLLSGHHHTFQVFNYEQNLPPQLISGHGGDYLDKGAPENPAGLVMNGVRVSSGLNRPGEFGFTLFERQPDATWRIVDRNVVQQTVRTCTLANRKIDCPAP